MFLSFSFGFQDSTFPSTDVQRKNEEMHADQEDFDRFQMRDNSCQNCDQGKVYFPGLAMNYIDCDRLIFNYQYSGALHDSTAQLAYKGKKIWMGQIVEAREAVYEHMDRILKGSFHDQTEYDVAFERTAHIVCDEFNKAGLIYNPEHPDEYTFGNAQKLINMTCKNMYAVTYGRPELKENFRQCHCPMDSIMLNRIWNAYSSAGNDLAALGDKYDFHKSWGNEDWDDRSRYNAFQYAVRILCKQITAEQGGPLIPIELDYFLWSE